MCDFSSNIQDYEVRNMIGKGGFASVYRGRVIATNLEVAIKVIEKRQIRTKSLVGRVKQEITIHSRLKHPSILDLCHYFEGTDYVYLILDLCHNGEIQKYMKSKGIVFSEPEARRMMQQIVEGLLYLHRNNIIHRDLKLQNLLLTKDMDVKIADFGLATQLSQPDEMHLTMCGTPDYISPEIAARSSHGLGADVWSLGCVFFTLLTGTLPFNSDGVKNTLNKVVSAKFAIPSNLSMEATDLVKRLLCKNPNERIKLCDILNHPFMAKNNAGNIETNILSELSGRTDSGMYTASSNSSRNSRPVSNRLPMIEETNKGCERPRCNSQSSVGGMQLLKSKTDLNKCSQEQISRSKQEINDENACPCSKSHCEHVHNTHCCSHGSGCRNCCEKTKNNYKSPCCSHLSPCYDANKCSHFDACGCRKEMEKVEPSKNQRTDAVSPLNTTRLKPMQYTVKNVVFSILQSGEVCVETMKTRKGVEVLENQFKISSDGLKMTARIIHNGKQKTHEYDYKDIPAKYLTKYLHAQRFINVVKEKSPKITFFSDEAKCHLMENSPNSNFEVTFYTGEKISKTSRGIVFTEKELSYTPESVGGIQYLSAATKKRWDHFHLCHQHCLRLEETISAEQKIRKDGNFPVTIGHKPVVDAEKGQTKQSPEGPNLRQLSGFTIGSNPQSRNVTPDIPKTKKETTASQVEVKRAYKVAKQNSKDDDKFAIEYTDGSQLICSRCDKTALYIDPKKTKWSFGEKDTIPKDLKKYFSPVYSVVDRLYPE